MSEETEVGEPTPVYVIGANECRIGLHPDADGMVLLAFPKNNMCLGFKLEIAMALHDDLCMALAMLTGGEETDNPAALPPLDKPMGLRQDN